LLSAFPTISKIFTGIKGGVAAENCRGRRGSFPGASGVSDYCRGG